MAKAPTNEKQTRSINAQPRLHQRAREIQRHGDREPHAAA